MLARRHSSSRTPDRHPDILVIATPVFPDHIARRNVATSDFPPDLRNKSDSRVVNEIANESHNFHSIIKFDDTHSCNFCEKVPYRSE